MSRTKHHRSQGVSRWGVELWKPRPLVFASKNAENLRLERRIVRHVENSKARQMVRDMADKVWFDEL